MFGANQTHPESGPSLLARVIYFGIHVKGTGFTPCAAGSKALAIRPDQMRVQSRRNGRMLTNAYQESDREGIRPHVAA
jgi:hypothetical protein